MKRKKLLAVCGAVAIACGSVTAVDGPVAGAYVEKPREFVSPSPDAVNSSLQPQLTTAIDVDLKEVNPGDRVKLTVTGEVKAPFPVSAENPKPGESNILGFAVEFELPDGIELDGEPSAADFKWKNNNGPTPTLQKEGNSYLFEFALDSVKEGDAYEISVPAKVNESVAKGTELKLVAGAQARIYPATAFNPVGSPELVPDPSNPCVETAKSTHRFEAGNYGAWLSEIQLGTSTREATLGEPQFKFFDGQNDITDAVMSRAVRNAENHQSVPTADEKRNQEYPNTNWLERYDWGINPNHQSPKDSLGEIFIPSGTTFEVTQKIDGCRAAERPLTYDVFASAINVDLVNFVKDETTIVVRAEETPPTVTTTETTTATKTTTATTTTTETTTETTTADCDCTSATTTETVVEPTTVTQTSTATTTEKVVEPTTVTQTSTATTTEKVPEPTTETETATTTATETATQPTTVTATETTTATTTATEKATETVTTTVTTTPATPVDPQEPTPTVPATSTPTAPGKTAERCFANAIASPLFYLVPVGVLAAVGGELARPYAGALNEQLARINADIQAAFQQDSPDRGRNGRTPRNDDPSAALRAQIADANRRFQEIASDPNVQRIGMVAAVIFGLAAASAILYDWCSSEPGKAFTAVEGSSAAERFLNRNR